MKPCPKAKGPDRACLHLSHALPLSRQFRIDVYECGTLAETAEALGCWKHNINQNPIVWLPTRHLMKTNTDLSTHS